MEYPLYDELTNMAGCTDDKFDINVLCTTINNISTSMSQTEYMKHYREITALIIHHNYLTTGQITIPFEGKTMIGGKGLLFYMMKLPTNLQKIIYAYTKTYSI